MSNEELVRLYQEGNKEALNILIEQNKGIIFKIANKFYIGQTNSISVEDLEQEGYIGLMIAAQKYKFDKEKKAKFSTYAIYWIYQKINRFVKQKNTNDEVSLNTKIYETEEDEKIDFIKDDDNRYENIEEKLYIKQLRKDLEQAMNENTTLREREAMKLYHGLDCNKCTYPEIGEIFNVSRERVRQILRDAYKKIRKSNTGKELKLKYAEELIFYKGYNSFKAVERRIDFEAERRKIEEQLKESERILALYEKCLDI